MFTVNIPSHDSFNLTVFFKVSEGETPIGDGVHGSLWKMFESCWESYPYPNDHPIVEDVFRYLKTAESFRTTFPWDGRGVGGGVSYPGVGYKDHSQLRQR